MRSRCLVVLGVLSLSCAAEPSEGVLSDELGSCGNGRCGGHETCSSCPSDCGSCAPAPDSGAGASSDSGAGTSSDSGAGTSSDSAAGTTSDSAAGMSSDSGSATDAGTASSSTVGPRAITCTGVRVSPGTSLQSVIDANASGTTLCLGAGDHRVAAPLTPTSGMRLIGELGARINGSKLINSWTASGSVWVATGQTQQRPLELLGGGPTYDDLVHKEAAYPDNVFFDDFPLRRVLTLAEVGPGKFYFDYVNDRIYIGDNPSGHKIEGAVAPGLIATAGINGVTVQNLILEKSAGYGVWGHSGTDWVVADNEIRFNHTTGCKLASRGHVLRNYIHHNFKYGLNGSGYDLLIEGNELAHNNWARYKTLPDGGYWDAGATKFVVTTRMIVRNNYSHHNVGDGLWADIDNIDMVFENNRLEYNERFGIFYEISYAAVIRNNRLIENGDDAVRVASSPNVELVGNTIVSTGAGRDRLDTDLGAHHDGGGIVINQQGDRGTGAYGARQTQNAYVHDNVSTMYVGFVGGSQWGGFTQIYTSWNNRFEYNTYYTGSSTTRWWRWLDALRTKSEWQSYGHDDTGTFLAAP